MRQYQIIKIGEVYYPQVRSIYKFLFIKFYSKWKRIGKHIDGFGLYNEYTYGQNINLTYLTIKQYEEWISRNKTKKVYATYDQHVIENDLSNKT